MWIVVFALLEDVSALNYDLCHGWTNPSSQVVSGNSCSGGWYYNYWSFYWGRYWRRPAGVPVFGVACGEWRSVLGFSFLSSILWLFSGILVRAMLNPMLLQKAAKNIQGMYAISKYRDESRDQSRDTNGYRTK